MPEHTALKAAIQEPAREMRLPSVELSLRGHGLGTAQVASTFDRAYSSNNLQRELTVRQQLDRILQSPVFINSARLSRFLRFVVEHVLNGSQTSLKEYLIGSEVYDRKPPYHPSQDSIVRTEARRLRNKLKEYYSEFGAEDTLFICLHPGSYVPTFQHKALLNKDSVGLVPLCIAQAEIATIAILHFQDISRTTLSSILARGLPDELAYALISKNICKVISPNSIGHLASPGHQLPVSSGRTNATFAYEASVREEDSHIRVTAAITDRTGLQIWAQRFDVDGQSYGLFDLEKSIASRLSAGIEFAVGSKTTEHD